MCECVYARHLDQVWGILPVQGVFGQLVSVRHPGVSNHLSSCQPSVRVHVQHLGHQVLNEGEGPSSHTDLCSGKSGVCHTLTFASLETEFQYPPESENLPLPIRAKISSGVSSGPLAKGVKLESKILILEFYPKEEGGHKLTGF